MAKPLKESELRKFAKCANCKRPVGKTGVPMFYLITVEQHFIDMAAVNRQQGLAMVLGGNGALASVMGPNEDMTKPLHKTVKLMICHDCAHSGIILSTCLEDAGELYEAWEGNAS